MPKSKARGAAQSAPPSVVIRGPGGVAIPLTHPQDMPRKALKWAYTVRNRVRWATDAEVRRRVTESAKVDLKSMGLGKQELQQLAEGNGGHDEVELIESDGSAGRHQSGISWRHRRLAEGESHGRNQLVDFRDDKARRNVRSHRAESGTEQDDGLAGVCLTRHNARDGAGGQHEGPVVGKHCSGILPAAGVEVGWSPQARLGGAHLERIGRTDAAGPADSKRLPAGTDSGWQQSVHLPGTDVVDESGLAANGNGDAVERCGRTRTVEVGGAPLARSIRQIGAVNLDERARCRRGESAKGRSEERRVGKECRSRRSP